MCELCKGFAICFGEKFRKNRGISGKSVRSQDSAIVVPDAVSGFESHSGASLPGPLPGARGGSACIRYPVPPRGSPAARDKCFWKGGNRVICLK